MRYAFINAWLAGDEGDWFHPWIKTTIVRVKLNAGSSARFSAKSKSYDT